MLRTRLPPALVRWRVDIVAVFALFALTVVGAWDLLHGGTTVGPDAALQFYPWYSFLGESLRSGEVPGWNPHQFSGTPFAADPLSGWTYLPAMLLFTFLPFVVAAKSYMFLHLLLPGLSVYALARVIGMGTPGALLAAVAYEYSSYLYLQNICCPAYPAVMSLLPIAILGVELAIRSSSWLNRCLWWGVSGLALSQILAAWLGQGSYYAMLALGGYVAYRMLLFPPGNAPDGLARKMGVAPELLGAPFLGPPTSIIRLGFSRKNLHRVALGTRDRFLGCVMHGGAVFAFGFGLDAAGVLPRLEYNTLSNLAGGYPYAEIGPRGERVGGWSVGDWSLLLEPGYYWYAGATILVLAVVAPLVAWKRFAVPYFAALSLGALILAGQGPTPLHLVLYYLLPRFESLHPHDPDRVMLVFYLGAALLAGAALTVLGERVGKKPLLLVLPVLAALFLAKASTLVSPIELSKELAGAGRWEALHILLALISAVLLVSAYALIPARLVAWRRLAFAVLALVVFADLLAANRTAIAGYPNGVGVKMDLAAYYRPSDAARFVQSKSGEEPFRYFGFGPQYVEGASVSSPIRFDEPKVRALEVGNRAMTLGLQSIQGYNALHLDRYDEYIRVLNQYEQNRHHTDVFDEHFDSPLLHLLNARYIIVPADSPPESQAGLQRVLHAKHPTVYEDDQLKVLENREALPRAWIVHSARQVRSREEALDLLSVGQVDPEETA
ncbi:MAG: hypothetical protein QOI57_350, partial [Rubrobacteraceae bacterium]|nr:hypothetical protein [Rubrobacteraceae bacterium]